MKTYFNYEGRISSKDLAEAIAFPAGIGPFMGFGSATVTPSKITLHPRSDSSKATNNPSPYFKDINDRVVSRNIVMKAGKAGSNSIPFHGLITRTGHIFVSTQSDIEITTRGTKGSFDEVLVFAIYEDVQEPINNIPTFVAYWNTSTQSFYEYWKRSIDSDYGKTSGFNLDASPWSSDISFEDLQLKVAESATWYRGSKTAVFIGAYGSGNNVETNSREDFALVPYGGVYPQSIPFTPDYYYKLKKVLRQVQDFTLTGLDGYSSLKAYIDYRLGSISGPSTNEERPGEVPVGGIILWYGTNIPSNYRICDGNNGTPDLSGFFVRGAGKDIKLGSTGGSPNYTLGLNNLPAHKHGGIPSLYKNKGDNKSSNTSNMALWNNNEWGGQTSEAGQSNPSPIDIIPPYFALYYIMRVE